MSLQRESLLLKTAGVNRHSAIILDLDHNPI